MNIEHAWAAGFWDGEGCVTIAVRNNTANPRIVAEVVQVNREVLDRFGKAVGIGKVNGPYKQKNPNAQPYYSWRVEGLQNLLILKDAIYPYLGSVKKSQLMRAIDAKAEWEIDPRCQSGHALTRGSTGKYYCKTCVTANGKARALPSRKEKKCGRCQTVKLLEEFNKHNGRRDGRQTMCRACMVSYRNER